MAIVSHLDSTESFAEPAVQDGLVGVDAAVAEEGPVAAGFFAFGGIAFDDENFFLVIRSFGNHLAERVCDKRIAPEFQSRVTVFRFAFKADAIDDRGVDAVSDGVTALDGFPGVELRSAELRFFVGMPPDAGGIKNHVRATESGKARTFRIPRVPADLDPDTHV